MPAGEQAPVTRFVTAIIPAHNEELTLAATIACLREQSAPPDRVIIACDNCADDTEAVARISGADVYVTRDNRHMKAGALNYVLELIAPNMDVTDVIMVFDADSVISPNFTAEALRRFNADPSFGGLSGIYRGKPGGGLVGWSQRNEFARWGFDARQQDGKAICLSGTATAFTVGALRAVKTARQAGILGGGDSFYATENFTEDFEMTQALLHLGYRIRNMMDVSIMTAIKPTWGELHTQRLRWNRGITETLLAYGVTRYTRSLWLRWALYATSVLAIPLSFFLIGYRVASGEGFHMNAWMVAWLAVTAIIGLHKSVTIAGTRGWSALAAALIVPEMLYDSFLHVTWVRSLCQVISGAGKTWR
jgi:cellulose synthase/poly-beta-1,6-N-acetylglucosamine synthase-like glycosyltransferase